MPEPASSMSVDNTTSNATSTGADVSWTYTEGVCILMVLCTLSMIVNTRVLASVHWIKRPLSATLRISLSLAAADLATSLVVFLNFFLNSYLAQVRGIHVPDCVALVFEAVRLGGIVNTVLHLLLLACNHYLGIVRPLHYNSIMTHGKVSACLVALWVLPPVYMMVYFATYTGEGFQDEGCVKKSFLYKLDFRLMFTLLLVVPFLLMTLIYSHILVLVRRQQLGWARAAARGASCRHRGGGGDARRRLHLEQRREQQLARNIKALHTTLLILGSFVAGLLPPIATYILTCVDCPYPVSNWSELFWFVNVLLVTKPLANPIIYAARMHEIKEATRRMRTSLCVGSGSCRRCSGALPLLWLCCGWSALDGGAGGAAGAQHAGPWPRDDASCTSASQLCRLTSNTHTPSKHDHMSTVL